MAEDWAAIASEVADAIGSVGFTAYVRRATFPPVDTNKPWLVGQPTIQDLPVLVVHAKTDKKTENGTAVLTGERTLMVAATGTVPTPRDGFVIGSDEYEIVSVEELNPGNVTVLFEIVVKK